MNPAFTGELYHEYDQIATVILIKKGDHPSGGCPILHTAATVLFYILLQDRCFNTVNIMGPYGIGEGSSLLDFKIFNHPAQTNKTKAILKT
jgi:hypothetical protein